MITWVVKKKTVDGKLGVTFRSKWGRVYIYKVSGRAASNTDLVPGLRVLQVCGKDVSFASEAVKLIKAAPLGGILIVTEGMHHSATKVTKDEKAGFGIQPSKVHKGCVEISRVNPAGMFPDVKVGKILWSINGKKINNIMQAIKLMKKKSTLKIVVVDPSMVADALSTELIEPTTEPVNVESLTKGEMTM